MAQAAEFCSFQAKIASRGYHVYKNTTWVDAREGDEVQVDIETNKESIKLDPYAFAIRVKKRLFGAMETVGHIPREISRHVYFFIKIEGGSVNEKALSEKYRPSLIPSGGLEIPLMLTFKCTKSITFLKMKKFISELYDYEYTGEGKSEESEEEDEIPTFVDDDEEDEKSNNNETEEVRVPAIVSYEISDEELDITVSC